MVAAGTLFCCVGARAAVSQSADDAFTVVHSASVSVSPLHVWLTLTRPSRWWDSAHTWSGDAANLNIDTRAGGCFCENWKGGSVEHMRVVWVTAPSELRLSGGLGPLQSMAVDGLLSFTIKPQDAGSVIELVYHVSGDSTHQLSQISAAVDGVLGAQLQRLQKLLDAPPAAAN